MDIYTYVAHSNPFQAKAILHKYGYSTKGVQNENDLGVCLKQLVAYEGENAFNDILNSHPDTNVIVEKFSLENKDFKNASGGTCGCGCSHCRGNDRNYNNFSGNADNASTRSKTEASVFIMAAALLIAAAIIVKK